MSTLSNPPPIPPRRSVGECGSPELSSSHVTGRCAIHADHFYTRLCTDCVVLLCNQCLRVPDNHSECTLCYINNDTSSLREQITSSVTRNSDDLVTSVKRLRRTLIKKRERMIKKKNETAAEIERYFNKLRTKVIAKLKRDEMRIMEKLKESVMKQESLISDSANECETILNTMREKSAEIRDSTSAVSDIERIQNTVNVQRENDTFTAKKAEIEGTRDAFLVIRFFVNSDTEQTILGSSPASVEVLNSRSNNGNQSNLESERIHEVSLLHASGNDSDFGSDISIRSTDIDNNGLHVSHSSASGHSRSNTSINLSITNIDESPSVIHQRSSSTPSRMQSRHSNNSSRASTPDNFLSTPVSTPRTATPDILSESSPHPIVRSSTPLEIPPINSTDVQTEQEPLTVNLPNSSQTEGNNTSQNVIENSSPPSQQQANTSNVTENSTTEPFDEDEPPPPYPGLPTQPGPDEAPPPYPGPPPPPYAQNPEPQQPSTSSRHRGRLFGESAGRARTASPVHQEVLLSPGRTPSPEEHPEPNVVSVKQVKSFSISELSDKRSSSISAMAVFNGRYFLVIDRWNKKLKYFSARGESFGGLIFREEPWDIAEITTDLFAVTVPKLNSIYKIQGTGDQVIAKSTVITERRYACVTYQSNNEVFVCGQVPQFGEPVIDVIGINGGPVLLTFRTTIHGQELFSYPRYVQVSNDSTVVVCDWNLKCVVFFKSDGTIIARYKGTPEFPLQEPTGITLNRELNKVFVIDSKRDSTQGVIHRVSMEGVCEHVYQRQDDFRDSRAISSYGDRISIGSKSGIINTYTTNSARSTRQRLAYRVTSENL